MAKPRDFEILNMRLTPELYLSIRAAARAEGMGASTWVRHLLIVRLGRKKKAA
jgi:hypothetical protein